jgi:ABC-2 type transport system permease protein
VSTTTSPVFVSTVKPEHRPGVAGVARSEWTKIRSLRSTFWTFAVTAGLTIGLGSLFALGITSTTEPFPAGFDAAGFSFNGILLAQLAIGVLGVLIITTEYSSGMIRTTLTAVPQRGLVLAVKAAVFGAVTFVVSAATAFVTFFACQTLLSRGAVKYGVSLSSPHALRIVIGAALYLTACALLGVALGALLRSTAAAITALATVLFILPIMMSFLPVSWHRDAITQWLPANAGVQILHKVAEPLQFGPWTGLAVFAGWVAVAFVAALFLLRRRDV